MRALSIAIDGPAGAGKSTLARRLAEKLGFLYVDTGAIYRTLGLFVERNGKSCTEAAEVIALLPKVDIALRHADDGVQHMFLQGEDVSEEIRSNRVSAYASQVSAIPEVRRFLLDMQRSLAKTHPVVMDGRDIGTVVLPDADLKIFLTATPDCRARRRQEELRRKGTEVPLAQLLDEMTVRDEADCKRAIAPLRRAADAHLLDTSALDLDESLAALYDLAKEHLKL